VLNAFHKKEGRFPEGSCDVTTVSQLVNDLLHENEVTDAAFVASLQASVSQLCVCAGAVVPVMAAVVGGFLAQEVLKAVSLVGEPMQNVFVFNGADNVGKAFPVAMPKKTARVPSAATTSEFEVL
jgi:ubiquitin-like 1-activating enzyme E1 A